ncbi:hypothetical protein IT775_09680 [Thalassobius aquimarinus]|uniref:Secreted protein n=3 Tax=Thalassovita aquimarina TaxID=2785917 RepID=A0ABS5HQZ0_9RHOB|nr:hypothetical protein [Thalassovita aquimarina]
MKCVFNLVVMALLTTTLVIAAANAGYARATHELSTAGNRTIVICGSAGQAETITLDRNGNPIDDPIEDCVHCADCSLVPVMDLTRSAISPRPEGCARIVWAVPETAPVVLREIESPSRGPPNQKVV